MHGRQSSIESISNLPRWEGSFPGEHEFSTLEQLKNSSNPELEVFFDAARRLVEEWRGNRFTGLYLYGTPGTGKSHAAIGLARELHEQGAEIHYRYGPTLLNEELRGPGYWSTERLSVEGTIDYSPTSVFPDSCRIIPKQNSYLTGQAEEKNAELNIMTRNPMSVLIFDDYRPDSRIALMGATEAAAQFGGLVIVTSNNDDPFEINQDPEHQFLNNIGEILEHIKEGHSEVPDFILNGISESHQSELQRVERASESFRSRVASAFKFINFTGRDRRQEQSFWN